MQSFEHGNYLGTPLSHLSQDFRERASRKVLLFKLFALAARWRRIHFLEGLERNGPTPHRSSRFETGLKNFVFRYSLGSRM